MGIDALHITFVRVQLAPVSALEVYPPGRLPRHTAASIPYTAYLASEIAPNMRLSARNQQQSS